MGFGFFKKAALFLSLAISQSFVFAKVAFEVLDLSEDNRLLFSVSQEVPGTPSYKSLFMSGLGKKSAGGNPELLTCFPEEMEILDGGRTVQLRNRYGSARYGRDSASLRWIEKSSQIPVGYSHISKAAESPDGKWLCYVEQKNHASGKLVLEQVSTGKKQTLVESIPFSYGSLPVKWAPDSASVLYENSGSVFFATPDAMFRNILIPENLRKIGAGTIKSVQWISGGSIFYIRGDIIYKIQENELYTRGLYSPLVGTGTPLARLPSSFDSSHASFFCSDDGKQIALISSDRLASVYDLPSSFDFVSVRGVYPLTGLSGSVLAYDVFWSSDFPVLWIERVSYDKGQISGSFYRLSDKMTPISDFNDVSRPVLSPDRRSIAFSSGGSLFALDLKRWTVRGKIDGEKVCSVKWCSPSVLIAGGGRSVFEWNLSSSKSGASGKKVLLVSSVDNAVWREGKIVSKIDGHVFEHDFETGVWKEISASSPSKTDSISGSGKNSRFRAYTASAQNPLYGNAIFIRSLTGPAITYPLCADTQVLNSNAKKVALVFDATESSEGLAEVLSWLERFGLKSTFFINGEFIRRCPQETRQILASGNECASSFFTSSDLLTQSFRVDADFIKRGLARNEDEFFAATGGELALLWHAPNYHANSLMKNAASESSYRYVDAWTKFSDRVSLEDAMLSGGKIPYLDAGSIIGRIEEDLHDGMIIPVNVGNVSGSRTDYLYEKLDLLICTILDSGYEICELRDLL